MVRPDKKPEEVFHLVIEEIEKIKKESVTPEELKKVKTRFKTNFVNRLERVLSRAMLLCKFELYDGDASLINFELEKYMLRRKKI